jgi:hypothetical protein
VEREVLAPGEFDGVVRRIVARELDPYSAATEILNKAMKAAAGRPGPATDS